MSVSKKDRFEIFKRDGFKCVYCGRQPPDVMLELEHIIAKSKGVTDSLDNYCTSCFDCNRGKGAIPFNAIPPSIEERLSFLQAKLEELRAMESQSEVAKQLRQKKMTIIAHLVNFWKESFDDDPTPQTITMMFNRLKWIDLTTMRGLIETCAFKMREKSKTSIAKYMSGILRNHLASIGIDYQKEIES